MAIGHGGGRRRSEVVPLDVVWNNMDVAMETTTWSATGHGPWEPRTDGESVYVRVAQFAIIRD